MGILKNLLLLVFIIIFSFEIGIRAIRPWLPFDITPPSTVLSDRGYWLNPNSGSYTHQINHLKVTYHFYPPHLRDTFLDKNANPILVLGDSFTFGQFLPWNDTFVNFLQEKINANLKEKHYQLLNAATGGWGTADYLAYLEEFGESFTPKVVLVFINTDDIGRSYERGIYKLSDNVSFNLTSDFRPIPIPQWKKTFLENPLIKNSQFIYFIRYAIALKRHMNFKEKVDESTQTKGHSIPVTRNLVFQDKEAIRYAEALFLRINDWCKAHQAKLIVITTGFNAFYSEKLHDPTKTFLTEANTFFKDNDISFLDLANDYKIKMQGKEFQIPGDQHPNALGAQGIGELSSPWLINQLQYIA